MNKLIRIILIVLFSVSALIILFYFAGGKNTIELAASGRIETYPKFTNVLIVWAYILTGLAVGLTIVFPVIQMVTNPKNAKKGLMGILALVVILGIAYLFASDEALGIRNLELAAKYDVPSTLKYAGMMINSIYILAVIAIVSMVYSEVAKVFK
ncbi:MAG: hypothetical protein KAR57_06790 [Bacteroidales bacterium]|nr:hypothetical protein [Bacteroidales bacterium]